ncbi:MAG: hypothetical protein K1X28_05015 [Parachlamydiales bacterium]|nr:hypothetical protein [Parachlamydiales bacterium]
MAAIRDSRISSNDDLWDLAEETSRNSGSSDSEGRLLSGSQDLSDYAPKRRSPSSEDRSLYEKPTPSRSSLAGRSVQILRPDIGKEASRTAEAAAAREEFPVVICSGGDAHVHAFRAPKAPMLNANSLKESELSRWVISHPESTRKAARIIASHLTFVRHSDFLTRLNVTLNHLNRQIELKTGRPFEPSQNAVVLVEGHKSNKWVAELARENFKFNAARYYRLGEKDARSFQEYLDANMSEHIRASFDGKSIILFDDGSYSGAQICQHIQAVIEAVRKHHLNISSIGVVIPYMTQHAFDALQRIKQQSPIPVFIGMPHIMHTLTHLNEKFGIGQALSRMWRIPAENLANLCLFVFQHKIPNYQSFPEPLARGKVCGYDGSHVQKRGRFLSIPFIDEAEPPYKQH